MSAQWYQNQISSTGLYWLEDLQHVYKETLLYFHGASSSNTELINLARTFQYYPVVTLPTSWYQQTRATLDLGGVMPYAQKISTNDQRQLTYPLSAYTVGDTTYQFNWVNFGDRDLYRKRSYQTGGWPYGLGALMVTENPSDYFALEERAIGELNLRKQWMAQYIHDQDWIF